MHLLPPYLFFIVLVGVNEIEVIKKARWWFTPRQEPKSISLLWGPVSHSKCQRDGCKSRSRMKGLFKKQERWYELWELRGAGKWKHFAQNHPIACNKCPRSAVYRAEPERNSFTLPERQKLVRRWHLSFHGSRNAVWNSRYRLCNEMSWSQFLLPPTRNSSSAVIRLEDSMMTVLQLK